MVFNIQSPYWFAIGRPGVLRLGGWTPHVQSGFHEPEPTRGLASFRLQGFHLLRPCIPTRSLFRWLIRVRSPLLTESRLLSFPAGTEMFQFSAFASCTYAFSTGYPFGWVAPFRNPRITVRLPTPLGLSQVPTSFIASGRQVIHREIGRAHV